MNSTEPDTSIQRRQDEMHLSLLSIFHYIYGGLTLLGGCFGLIYLGAAVVLFVSPEIAEGEEVSPQVIGGIMAAVGGCVMLLGFGIGALIIYAGYCLARQRKYVLCIVVAALMCLNIPLGMILGVFTLIVLARPSAKSLFEERAG